MQKGEEQPLWCSATMDTVRLVRELQHAVFLYYRNSSFLLVIGLQRRGLSSFSTLKIVLLLPYKLYRKQQQ